MKTSYCKIFSNSSKVNEDVISYTNSTILKEMVKNEFTGSDIENYAHYFLPNDETKFTIDSDMLVDTKLYISRNILHSTIFTCFKKNVDYIFKPFDYNIDSTKVIITENCFRRLCLLSQNSMSNVLLIKYFDVKDYIQNHLLESNSILDDKLKQLCTKYQNDIKVKEEKYSNLVYDYENCKSEKLIQMSIQSVVDFVKEGDITHLHEII